MNINSDGMSENYMTFGNKIALLGGDYLLCNSCIELASLRNQDVSLLQYAFSITD